MKERGNLFARYGIEEKETVKLGGKETLQLGGNGEETL